MPTLPTIDGALSTLFHYYPERESEYNEAVAKGRLHLVKLIREWGSGQFTVTEINTWAESKIR